jgi:hypothetical protein
MNDEGRDDLSREEREAFRSLAEISFHPGVNEDRIVMALRSKGLIGPSRRRLRSLFMKAAAAAAILAGAFLLGMQYGSHQPGQPEPMVKPVHEARPSGSDVLVTRGGTSEHADPTVLDDYRDEPDRPGDGGSIYAKRLDN